MKLYKMYKSKFDKLGKAGFWVADAIEQLGHLAIGFVITLFTIAFGMDSMIGAGLMPLIFAGPREIKQDPREHPWDTLRDTAFFIIGGLLAGLKFIQMEALLDDPLTGAFCLLGVIITIWYIWNG